MYVKRSLFGSQELEPVKDRFDRKLIKPKKKQPKINETLHEIMNVMEETIMISQKDLISTQHDIKLEEEEQEPEESD